MPDSDNFSLSGLLDELEQELEAKESEKDKAKVNEKPEKVDEAKEDWNGLLQGLEPKEHQPAGDSTRAASSGTAQQPSAGTIQRKFSSDRRPSERIQNDQPALPVERPWRPTGAKSSTAAGVSLAVDANTACRKYMEDGSKILDPFDALAGASPGASGGTWGFFAVYDGHGGREAVEYCELRLHEQVAQEMKTLGPHEALKATFQKIDSQLGMYGAWNHGTTATVALLCRREGTREGELYVAHVGDSRAVLIPKVDSCRSLTRDHRPSDPLEAERVRAEGGRVTEGRVGGDLAISRSLGDHRLKGKGVSPMPEVTSMKIADGQVLILATDGLWDVVTEELACALLEKSIKEATGGGSANPKEVLERLERVCAQQLVDEAIRLGSRDNVLALCIFL
ncbi:unnamed protein product [Durusdinium trenchii]|uniref:Protein phosphatase 2C homolog 1 (PP2C-1) n=2 Tax=Durusdinium trenchii TaxID=1381693 RepID=A0ABP0HN00_9DINO